NHFLLVVTVASQPWVFIELLLLSSIGAVYSWFTYEHSVLHMGDDRARLRRFLQQTDKAKQEDLMPEEKGSFVYFTYRLMGKKVTSLLPFFKGLKQILS